MMFVLADPWNNRDIFVDNYYQTLIWNPNLLMLMKKFYN